MIVKAEWLREIYGKQMHQKTCSQARKMQMLSVVIVNSEEERNELSRFATSFIQLRCARTGEKGEVLIMQYIYMKVS